MSGRSHEPFMYKVSSPIYLTYLTQNPNLGPTKFGEKGHARRFTS